MKILFLANQLLASKVATGGDKLFVEISSRLSKIEGIDVELVCPEIVKEELRTLINPRKITTLPSDILDNYKVYSRFVPYISIVYIVRMVRAVLKLIRRDVDVVYATGDFFPNIVPAVIYKIFNKKTVFISNIYHINESPFKRRGNSFILSAGSYLLQRLSLFMIKYFSDKIFLLNNIVKNSLLKSGFEEGKLSVIGAGLNFLEIEHVEIGTDRYDACFLGRLSPTKGVFDIPGIWERVVSRHKNAKLILVGWGSDVLIEKLRAEISAKRLEQNIILAGFLAQDEVYKVMKGSKLFIFPSYEEGWGISIFEAMACKLPVVSYDLPVFKEIFDGGIVKVPVGNIEKFSEAILYLYDNNTKLIELGKEGVAQAAKYDWDIIATKELDIIKNLLNGKHKQDKGFA